MPVHTQGSSTGKPNINTTNVMEQLMRACESSFPLDPSLQPSTMDQEGSESDYCHSSEATDCRHWSETGVVEEWNALLLNHICQ